MGRVRPGDILCYVLEVVHMIWKCVEIYWFLAYLVMFRDLDLLSIYVSQCNVVLLRHGYLLFVSLFVEL